MIGEKSKHDEGDEDSSKQEQEARALPRQPLPEVSGTTVSKTEVRMINHN